MAQKDKNLDTKPVIQTELTTSWQLIGKSVELIQQNIETVIIILVLPSLVGQLGLLLTDNGKTALQVSHRGGLVVLLLGIALLILNLPIACYLQLKATAGEHPTVQQCFTNGIRYFWRIFALEVIVDLMTVVGLICFIVPGLIILRRYYLAQYYVVDRNVGIIEAMHLSATESKPLSQFVWGTLAVVIGFGIAGAVISSLFSAAPGVGIILSVVFGIIYIFGPALRYYEIKKATKSIVARTKSATSKKH